MLLTLSQPGHHGVHHGVHHKSLHASLFAPLIPPSSSQFSLALSAPVPYPHSLSSSSSSSSSPPSSFSAEAAAAIATASVTTTATKPSLELLQSMSTPHRGLPLPAAMALPPASSAQNPPPPPPLNQPPNLSQSLGHLPAAPQQMAGAEEAMRNWLQAKSEEEKRKQEEEKTRQETLRLEQRRIEQDMLRSSLNGGIPPYLIPMIFAGMGGGNLPNASLEWAQHYIAQAHQQQPQIQEQQRQSSILPPHGHPSPELRRESRHISQLYAGQQQPSSLQVALPSTPIGQSGSSQQGPAFISSYPLSPTAGSRNQLPGSQSLGRPPPASHLPRLNTGEIHIQPPPSGPSAMHVLPSQPAHPLQQSQTGSQAQESQSSPSIYFHHWQPPASQAGSSGGNQSAIISDVHSSSPKKRKAQGPQQAAPPPTSQPRYTSPPFSQGGSSTTGTPLARRRRSRQRSDMSSRGHESYGRPVSRHRHTESTFSTTSGVSSPRQQGYESAAGPENTPTGRNVTHPYERHEPRQQQQQQQEPSYQSPASAEMRHTEGRSSEREAREREGLQLSARTSGMQDDPRD
ncbi:MAG: hypothetical protein M1818_000834 [Claussenomyces sp. TS43310]|nr:MAG: hypothetical protein M1818_000834 [Claussenomyces sp. TS43310]